MVIILKYINLDKIALKLFINLTSVVREKGGRGEGEKGEGGRYF